MKFLNHIARIVLFVIICIASSNCSDNIKDFPYHLDKSVDKEMMYDYAFEDVWEMALTAMKESEKNNLSEMRGRGLESISSIVRDDKDSGLITYTLSHKGNRGVLREKVKPEFSQKVLLIESVEQQKTRIYFHEINFLSFDNYVFHEKQLARYLEFTRVPDSVLETIHDRLGEKSRAGK